MLIIISNSINSLLYSTKITHSIVSTSINHISSTQMTPLYSLIINLYPHSYLYIAIYINIIITIIYYYSYSVMAYLKNYISTITTTTTTSDSMYSLIPSSSLLIPSYTLILILTLSSTFYLLKILYSQNI